MSFMTICVQLEKLLGWARSRLPFCHLRFNDGEMLHTFHLSKYGTRHGNNLETHTPDLQGSIRTALNGILSAHVAGRPVLVGSFMGSHLHCPGYMIHAKHQAPTVLQHLDSMGWSGKIDWAPTDLWYSTETEEQLEKSGGRPTREMDLLLDLLGAVRVRDHVVLVGPAMLERAAVFLHAHRVEVRLQDSFLDSEAVLASCHAAARIDPATVFVWCAGVAGKAWAWQLWQEHPGTSHLDAGCLFDGACGWRSRMWMRRDQSPHWLEYVDRLQPLVVGRRGG